MTFYENIVFPVNPSYGSGAGPGFNTSLIESDSGVETAIQRRSESKHVFDAAFHVREKSDVYDVLSLYRRVGGVSGGFLYQDLADYTSTTKGRLWGDDSPAAISDNDQVLGTGDGTTVDFQLVKTYGTATPQYVRRILKPVSGTVVVALDGVPTASGWSVDTTTGIVTFTSAPGVGVIVSAGYEFRVPVRFGIEVDQLLQGTIETWGDAEIPQIPMVEILAPSQYNERRMWGGATFLTVSADTNLSLLTAQFWSVDPQSGGLKLNLPAKASTPLGPDIFTIHNASGSNSIDVYDSDTAALVVNLSTGVFRRFSLGVTSGGSRIWRVHN